MKPTKSPLWTHLRAWRQHVKMSQEQVAALMSRKHSTISRWESGTIKLSTADLEALAAIYGVSVTQLQMPPDASDTVARLDRAQEIMSKMSAADLEAWLALGERLTGR